MTSSVARYDSSVEQRVLEELRPRYERRGYKFVVHPDQSTLPHFMHGYIPDAVATSSRENVAIEVKGSSSPGSMETVERLQKMFVGHDDWKLTVVYGGTDPQPAMDMTLADPQALQQGISSIEGLLHDDQGNAAIVMAFALLEAAMPLIDEAGSRRPQRPGTVIQALAMNGLISADQETQLRPLVTLRNRIVHGDLSIKVSPGDVRLLLDAVREVIAARQPKDQ